MGVACTGKRKCYNLSFRVGFACSGKLIRDVAPVCWLSGTPRTRLAQEGVLALCHPKTFAALRQAKEFHGPGLPHTVRALGSAFQSLHGGNTFAIPNQEVISFSQTEAVSPNLSLVCLPIYIEMQILAESLAGSPRGLGGRWQWYRQCFLLQ